MASRKGQQINAALQSKGFRHREGDHTFLILHVDGKQTSVHTKISHGNTEYGDDLLAKVGRQLSLRKTDLLQLIDCPLSQQAYIQMLTRNGQISFEE